MCSPVRIKSNCGHVGLLLSIAFKDAGDTQVNGPAVRDCLLWHLRCRWHTGEWSSSYRSLTLAFKDAGDSQVNGPAVRDRLLWHLKMPVTHRWMVQQLERCPQALEAVGSKPGSIITAFSPSPMCQGGSLLLIAWAFGEVKQCSSMRDRQPTFKHLQQGKSGTLCWNSLGIEDC